MTPRNQARGWDRFSLGDSRGTSPGGTLTSDFWPRNGGRTHFGYFNPPSLWHFFYGRPGKTNTPLPRACPLALLQGVPLGPAVRPSSCLHWGGLLMPRGLMAYVISCRVPEGLCCFLLPCLQFSVDFLKIDLSLDNFSACHNCITAWSQTVRERGPELLISPVGGGD